MAPGFYTDLSASESSDEERASASETDQGFESPAIIAEISAPDFSDTTANTPEMGYRSERPLRGGPPDHSGCETTSVIPMPSVMVPTNSSELDGFERISLGSSRFHPTPDFLGVPKPRIPYLYGYTLDTVIMPS